VAPRIIPLTTHALLVDWGNRIAPELNDKVQALYRALSSASLPGLRELVPAYSSLALILDPEYFDRHAPGKDPLDIAAAWVAEALQASVTQAAADVRQVEIPVCYEGDFAPDLAALAARSGLSVAEAVALHCGRTYRVYMLGFLPGFAYLGMVDERIAAARLARPRPRVEAGSVGIAGIQTGIYPLDSPGGWNIIGRTPLRMFDPERESPVLLRPGDEVRFSPISREEFSGY
jgi:inhibitor of KinA